uniref:polyadenylate-binding protein 2-like n=1 Tax=Jaculus jaculus TaxID=51337 RepID=UPI001E1B224B|nr:polyadenylate-binding protein 2-like [Jaculus jaculus]
MGGPATGGLYIKEVPERQSCRGRGGSLVTISNISISNNIIIISSSSSSSSITSLSFISITVEEEPGLIQDDPRDGDMEDPWPEAIKAPVMEEEEEAAKLRELHEEAWKQRTPSPGSAQEKTQADARSVHVGNVDYGATAQALEAHFHACGSVLRVSILCDRVTGHPRGFAYIEFSEEESARAALALDGSLFRGRQIKVVPNRANRRGMSKADSGFPRAHFSARHTHYSPSPSPFYSAVNCRPGGQMYRGRASGRSWWYSPYWK